MIPKGNQRGGGLQLAAHLQNTFDNDSVEIADLRGAIAPGLASAFSEWHAQARATNCKKYLYSLSLNPDQRQGRLTREQYLDFIARAEARLKLTNQPRAVVFHVKHGREHCHVVWSRIDTGKMRAIPMSHDHQKLRSVAREFAKDHRLELPERMKKDKGRDRYESQKDTADLHEKQQEERSGISKAERMKEIQNCWAATQNGEDFIRRMADKDYYLARGDRRGYVIVDMAGEVHSLSRQLKGVKAADLKARLSILPPDKLPDITRAQNFAKEVREMRAAKLKQEAALKKEATPSGPTPDERREQLRRRQMEDRRRLEDAVERVRLKHAREMGKMTVLQAMQNAKVQNERDAVKKKYFSGFMWKLLPVDRAFVRYFKKADVAREQEQKAEKRVLEKAHKAERVAAQRHLNGLLRSQKREAKSLEAALWREEFQRIAGKPQKPVKQAEKPRQPDRTAETPKPRPSAKPSFDRAASPAPPPAAKPPSRFQHLRDAFKEASASPERPQNPAGKQPVTGPERQPPDLRPEFNRAAEPPVQEGTKTPDSLTTTFNTSSADGQAAPPEPEKTDYGKSADELRNQFNRLASQRGRELDGDKGRDKSFRRKAPDRATRR